MASLNRDLTILLHMQEYCRQIEKTLKRFDNTYENFCKDKDFHDSISMKIFQIGELANHLSTEYLEQTKNKVNWNLIRGMRNRFTHGYLEMDNNIIYTTAIKDIPQIKTFLNEEIYKFKENLEEQDEDEDEL